MNKAYQDSEVVLQQLGTAGVATVSFIEPKGKRVSVDFERGVDGAVAYRVVVRGRSETSVGRKYGTDSPYSVLTGLYNAWGVHNGE